jgi:hypothetical protein
MRGAADFEAVTDAIRKWMWRTCGIQSIMEDEERPFMDPVAQVWGVFCLMDVAQRGVDETRIEQVAGVPLNESCQPTLTGLRRLIVSCRVESMTQEPGESAWAYGESLRTGLRLAGVKALFRRVGLSLIDTLPMVKLNSPVDDRIRSMVSFDMRLNLAVCMLDDPLGFIEQVQIRSEQLLDPAGNPVLNQIDETFTLP